MSSRKGGLRHPPSTDGSSFHQQDSRRAVWQDQNHDRLSKEQGTDQCALARRLWAWLMMSRSLLTSGVYPRQTGKAYRAVQGRWESRPMLTHMHASGGWP